MKGKLLFLLFCLSAVPAHADSFTAWNNVFEPAKNQSASFRYVLTVPGSHVIRIYTPAGELVREWAVQGTGSVIWDGTDGAGVLVASGVYFVQLTGPGLSKTQKAIVVK